MVSSVCLSDYASDFLTEPTQSFPTPLALGTIDQLILFVALDNIITWLQKYFKEHCFRYLNFIGVVR